MKIAPNRTRRGICSFGRLRGISKQIYLAFFYTFLQYNSICIKHNYNKFHYNYVYS